MIGDGSQRRLLQVIVPLELLHRLQNAVGNHRRVGHREGLEPLVIQRLAHYSSPRSAFPACQTLRRVDRQQALDEAPALGGELAPVLLGEGNGVDVHVLQRESGHRGRQRVVAGEQEVGDDADRPHVAGLPVPRALEVVHEHLRSDVEARAHQTVHVLGLVDELGVKREEEEDLAQTEVDQLDVVAVGTHEEDVGESEGEKTARRTSGRGGQCSSSRGDS